MAKDSDTSVNSKSFSLDDSTSNKVIMRTYRAVRALHALKIDRLLLKSFLRTFFHIYKYKNDIVNRGRFCILTDCDSCDFDLLP